MIIHGDALQTLKGLESESIDCIVTDPPYGYSFMNKDWDKAVVSVDVWCECLRVMKSGAFAFIMSSPRQDVLCKMILNLIDAGFETNFTSMYHTYASGFPKAANTSKLLQKRGINKEELNGSYLGFQPKPALEVILVVMKPLSEKSFVDQALSNQKGITWLDDCRIPFQNEKEINKMKHTVSENTHYHSKGTGWDRPWRYNEEAIQRCKERKQEVVDKAIEKGRFPANLIVSDDALNDGKIFKTSKSYRTKISDIRGNNYNNAKGKILEVEPRLSNYGDSGSYSRYFDLDAWFLAIPKASPSERQGSTHPTMKPIKLMSYLITMGSRENDLILDPFCGSGTTCIAATILNRRYIGIELQREYVDIANKRLESYTQERKITDFA